MAQQTVTAKVQVIVNDADKCLLVQTLSVYRDACNYVSDYIYSTHEIKQFELNKILYSSLREKFGLKSQMAQSVLKTVIAKYKTIKANQKAWIKPVFEKPQYDLVWNRDYSLNNNAFSVNTIAGRIKFNYYAQGMEKYFDSSIYKFGTAKLVNKHGKYYLHIPVTYDVPDCNINDISNVVGIDRGINFVVATYNSKHKSGFVSGKAIKQKRAAFVKTRKQLQMRHTSSARKRLKAIGQRENRWMQDVNHCVSKALVENNPQHTLFVLENLTGVRSATEKIRTKYRAVPVSWAFYDLGQKLKYKAVRKGSMVVEVNPAYTSQCCPICGHTEKANRDKHMHLFTCKNCGYRSNDDRIGAMNLFRMGIDYLAESSVKKN